MCRITEFNQCFLSNDNRWSIDLTQTLQSGCKIHSIGDHGAFHTAFTANNAKHKRTSVDPDSAVDGSLSELTDNMIEFNQFNPHLNGCIYGIFSIIRKQCHDGISHKFINKTIVVADNRLHITQVIIKEIKVFFWSHLFWDACEVTDVSEKYCHFFLNLVTQLDVCNTVFSQVFKKLPGNEACICLVDHRDILDVVFQLLAHYIVTFG